MFKRPKSGEDEDDILRMQEEYLREKSKNEGLQPAAQVTNLRPSISIPTKRPIAEAIETRKPSKFAQSRGLKNYEKKTRSETSLVGDIIEKNIEDKKEEKVPVFDDDKVYFPKVIPSLMGEIVEKNVEPKQGTHTDASVPTQGFPIAMKRRIDIAPGSKSIYTEHLEKIRHENVSSGMEIDEASFSDRTQCRIDKNSSRILPQRSYVISSTDATEIHSENVNLLKNMSEKEILEEKEKLMSTLDLKLVKFLQSKRKTADKIEKFESSSTSKLNDLVKMDTEDVVNPTEIEHNTLWENDVLSHPNVNDWVNFNSLEKDKLEWMKGIEESQNIKGDEPFEARFDFTGYLLPHTIEYTEKTKTLFHHGEEPNRPGYTLTELFELSRSTIIQQRVMALNALAGVLEYYISGIYKDVIDVPLSKIFFVIRIAMDENKLTVLEPALKAMRNCIYNKIDEACLDALIGFEEGMQQPCLENDKSEIQDLDSMETEFKDFHLAEIDIISALLRTDILQRIYYILELVKPSYNCVQYCLQILTRLARDSTETAHKIVETNHLMNTVMDNFVPKTSINFMFDPNKVYQGKPVLTALKLIRVLSLQSREIGDLLVNRYDLLTRVSDYISSGVDGTYGLRIQIEAFSIVSNLLCFGYGVENIQSLCPVVVTTLYKHVQGTDIFIDSSVISATHAAVVMQLINTTLACNFNNKDSFKHQVYPLIKEGVQKWMAQLSSSRKYTCGHLRLLCSSLDICKTIIWLERVPLKFLNDSLKVLSSSSAYSEIVKQLIPNSNLLSGIESNDLHRIKNLMSVGGSVIKSTQKVLPALNTVSPIPFLASLFKVLGCVNDPDISKPFLPCLTVYLMQILKKSPSLCDNWFTRIETDLLFSIIQVSATEDLVESKKDLLYAVANKLCFILRVNKRFELEFLFYNIVFNKNWITAERLMNLMSLSDSEGFPKTLKNMEQIKMSYSKVINLQYRDTMPNIVLRNWQEPILPRDWIYLPILNLYSTNQEIDTSPKVLGEHATRVAALKTTENEIIVSCCLEWILFNELCFPDLIKDIDLTDRFCRILCVFLCDNSLFLNKNIKILLRKCTQLLFKIEKRKTFNFDKQLTGLNNFQDFYTQLLEQFQSVSYGDATFAACILVPLAQKHNMKWRKLLWSEYAGCLRALDCPLDVMCYDINDYLFPEETDNSLIKSYIQALSSNLLRPNTIAHKIAVHHTECYRKRQQTT